MNIIENLTFSKDFKTATISTSDLIDLLEEHLTELKFTETTKTKINLNTKSLEKTISKIRKNWIKKYDNN